jgi:hypothetical protein
MPFLNEIGQVHPTPVATFLLSVYRMFDDLLKCLCPHILRSFL